METEAIIDRAFALLAEDTETQIILMPGDLSRDGEKASNLLFLEKLKGLQERGKKIYVITARHDYNNEAEGFCGSEQIPVEGTRRDELVDLYWDYGFSDAIALDREHLSYVAQLAPGVRLLALNCDGDCEDFKGFPPKQQTWIFDQIAQAKAAGDVIFAMTHYPVLPGSPIFQYIGDAVLTHWQDVTRNLADAGLPLIFTGHMHIQSVNKTVTANGNVLYDVCTGSLVGYPCAMRKVVLHPDCTAEITSSTVDDFDWDKQRKTANGYFIWRFERMIRDILESMWHDPERFLGFIGLSDKLKENKIMQGLIRFTGKRLNTWTLGKTAHLLFFRADQSIQDVRLADKAVELVRNVFAGDQPYTKETPEYRFLQTFLHRLRLPIRIAERKLGEKQPLLGNITALVLGLVGKEHKIDNHVLLDLKRQTEMPLPPPARNPFLPTDIG